MTYAQGTIPRHLLGLTALLALACGSTPDDAGSGGGSLDSCVPDEIYQCACPGGAVGSQVCMPSGAQLTPCDCGGSVASGGATVGTGGGTGAVGAGATPSSTGGTSATGGASTGGVAGASPGGAANGGAGGGAPVGGAAGAPAGGAGGSVIGDGTCCADGDCICRGEPPSALTSDDGPYGTDSYSLFGVGCVYYPTDAEPPFSAVTVSDGYLGTGGCGYAQTSGWGDFYASYGIVTMIIETGAYDQPRTRGRKLLDGVAALKAENENGNSPLFGLLAGRYGTSGFSMGGGGTTFAASDDPSLRSSVALMPWTPTGSGVTVPTLITCGSSDGLATCLSHGGPAYNEMPDTTPKMRVTVPSGHAGQPSSGGGTQGAWGLAFQKVFLDGDERWKSVLLSGNYDETTIQ